MRLAILEAGIENLRLRQLKQAFQTNRSPNRRHLLCVLKQVSPCWVHLQYLQRKYIIIIQWRLSHPWPNYTFGRRCWVCLWQRQIQHLPFYFSQQPAGYHSQPGSGWWLTCPVSWYLVHLRSGAKLWVYLAFEVVFTYQASNKTTGFMVDN